jgi:DNA-binding beta-propeller fold protein YncE
MNLFISSQDTFMNRRVATALLFVAAITPALAQAPASAPAAPFTPPASTLSSLFGRYTLKGDFGVKEPKEWGGTTTWVAADGKGTVVVMVRVAPYFRFFNTDGQPLRQWGDKELFTGEPHSVHFGPDGSIWATDSVDHTVRKFSPTGQLLLTLGKQKVAGDNTSQDAFNRPNVVAFDSRGNVFVSDGYANQRVVQFTPEGKFVRIFGGKKGNGDGEMAMVHGVSIDAQGRIYATDSDNQRVVVFDAQGKFVRNIPIPGRGGSFLAADGTFYISDVNSGAVAIMKNDVLVDFIKVEGRPHGLAVDPTTGDVYTSSTVATRPGITKATLRQTASAAK